MCKGASLNKGNGTRIVIRSLYRTKENKKNIDIVERIFFKQRKWKEQCFDKVVQPNKMRRRLLKQRKWKEDVLHKGNGKKIFYTKEMERRLLKEVSFNKKN